MSDDDECVCGDYRRQHDGGVGRCLMRNDIVHGYRECTKFRLVGTVDWEAEASAPQGKETK